MAKETEGKSGKAPEKKKLVKGRHLSAIKRARQSLRRRAVNEQWESRAKTFEKKVLVAIESKDTKKAQEALVEFMSQIDKAAQKGAVHAKRASRRISSISKQVAKIVS